MKKFSEFLTEGANQDAKTLQLIAKVTDALANKNVVSFSVSTKQAEGIADFLITISDDVVLAKLLKNGATEDHFTLKREDGTGHHEVEIYYDSKSKDSLKATVSVYWFKK